MLTMKTGGSQVGSGPLAGCRVIEMAGIGPAPFGAMLLADMGADVIRVDRADAVSDDLRPDLARLDVVGRGRRSIGVDLKDPAGVELVLRLVAAADVLVEGFRPGVMERIGLGPVECRARNSALVYGRMTGWGQQGPLAQTAAHDINFIALTGALALIGRRGQPPTPPVNLVADYGGGGMLLAFGLVCALLEARDSGVGQVVDASMLDGTALLTTPFHAMVGKGQWRLDRGVNLLDSGAPFYDDYECADGQYVALGAIEPKFYAVLREKLGLADDPLFDDQYERSNWPLMKQRVAEIVGRRTRDEWCRLLDGSDACFAPVLTITEAPNHPHNRERATYVAPGGIVQPAPAPRFDRTPGAVDRPPPCPGQHTEAILAEAGYDHAAAARLISSGAFAQAKPSDTHE